MGATANHTNHLEKSNVPDTTIPRSTFASFKLVSSHSKVKPKIEFNNTYYIAILEDLFMFCVNFFTKDMVSRGPKSGHEFKFTGGLF